MTFNTTLRSELGLFEGADRILVHFAAKDEYQKLEDGPGYNMFYIKDVNPDLHKRIEVINEEQLEALNTLTRRQPPGQWGIGADFRVLIRSDGMLDCIYEETPLLNLIYELMGPKLMKFFGKYK